MQAILYKAKNEPWFRLGGMTLLERNLRYLQAEGVSRATIVLAKGENLPALSIPRPLHLWPNIEFRGDGVTSLEQAMANLRPSDSEADAEADSVSVFIYDANTLVDQRTLAALKSRDSTCLLLDFWIFAGSWTHYSSGGGQSLCGRLEYRLGPSDRLSLPGIAPDCQRRMLATPFAPG